MPDDRFFLCADPLPVEAIPGITGGALAAIRPEAGLVTAVAARDEADLPGKAVFLSDDKDIDKLAAAGPCLVITTEPVCEQILDLDPGPVSHLLATKDPRAAFARLATHLYQPRSDMAWNLTGGPARVDDSADVSSTAVIGNDAIIGPGTFVGPGAAIGPGVIIGRNCYIGPNATVLNARIGDKVRISSNAIIGESGFGFALTDEGPLKVPQLGRVLIEDDVDIGSCTTVDRGSLGDTIIGAKTKIDNLCQIAHNVRMGQGCILAAHVGISGSCTIGDNVLMGGQVGLVDHVSIGSNSILNARTAAMRNLPEGSNVGGVPARPIKQWLKEQAVISRMAKGKTKGGS